MSSDNTFANSNVLLDGQDTKSSAEANNCRMDTKNAIKENNAVENVHDDAAAATKNGTLEMSPDTSDMKVENPTENHENNCDICNADDVDNITNSLAEKIKIIVETEVKCDKKSDENYVEQNVVKNYEDSKNLEVVKSDEASKEKDVMEVSVTPEKIVKKINESNESGALSRDTSLSKSNVVVKHQTASLKNLLQYDSSSGSSSSSSSEDDNEADVEPNWQFRTINKSDSESDDSLSSEEDSDDDDDDDDVDDEEDDVYPVSKKSRSKVDSPISEDFAVRIFGENRIHDIPPICDISNLDIDFEKEEFLHMGHIEAIIETLITVEALPSVPAYDLDTCLFIEDTTLKRPLGAIYDVMGPVSSPVYCIRFASVSDIAKLNLKKGVKVFSAPKSNYTKYVFVRELMKHRGTDASWVGDKELPPEIAAQLSDDEFPDEQSEVRKTQKRKHTSQERHKRFEQNMNRCNTLNTQAAHLINNRNGPSGPRMSRYGDHAQRSLFNEPPVRLPPSFNPTLPPPGFHFVRSEDSGQYWSRIMAGAPMRPPRHMQFGPGQGPFPSFPNPVQNQFPYTTINYWSSDNSHGPGTSSHPY